ncbi:MAG TPA: stalk domain-containing protein [Anaerovoracaceae bacterium]|nr:stalk domain-containing protein [Anaerovoracaceae bacterium]
MLKKRLICIILFLVSATVLPPAGASATTAAQARPTASSVVLNGAKVSFEAYNIDNNNYFKLRDLAKALSGGAKQFEVTWDASENAVNILTNHAYTPVGGELALPGSNSIKTAVPSNSKVTINGTVTSLTAYYIDGNNYFKLRDIGKAIGFEVAYDGVANTVIINSEFIVYSNTQYGFNFTLPKSWENYSILTDQWEGYLITGEESDIAAEAGVMIKIRHPQWTSQTPRQDIPIMIFTPAQWDKVQKEELSVSAAPIPPSELGRNSEYVFALPARYNYAFPEGFEEVESILADNPLQPI